MFANFPNMPLQQKWPMQKFAADQGYGNQKMPYGQGYQNQEPMGIFGPYQFSPGQSAGENNEKYSKIDENDTVFKRAVEPDTNQVVKKGNNNTKSYDTPKNMDKSVFGDMKNSQIGDNNNKYSDKSSNYFDSSTNNYSNNYTNFIIPSLDPEILTSGFMKPVNDGGDRSGGFQIKQSPQGQEINIPFLSKPEQPRTTAPKEVEQPMQKDVPQDGLGQLLNMLKSFLQKFSSQGMNFEQEVLELDRPQNPNQAPAPPQPAPQPAVQAHTAEANSAWGDPHYDKMMSDGTVKTLTHKGVDDHTYNLLDTSAEGGDGLIIDGKYGDYNDPNNPTEEQIISDLMIRAGKDQIQVDKYGNKMLNGKALTEDITLEDGTILDVLDNGGLDIYSKENQGNLQAGEGVLRISNGAYTNTNGEQDGYLNVNTIGNFDNGNQAVGGIIGYVHAADDSITDEQLNAKANKEFDVTAQRAI